MDLYEIEKMRKLQKKSIEYNIKQLINRGELIEEKVEKQKRGRKVNDNVQPRRELDFHRKSRDQEVDEEDGEA